MWHKNDVFYEILGCADHLTLPKKKWAPVAVKIFYKYAVNKWVMVENSHLMPENQKIHKNFLNSLQNPIFGTHKTTN